MLITSYAFKIKKKRIKDCSVLFMTEMKIAFVFLSLNTQGGPIDAVKQVHSTSKANIQKFFN